MIMELWVILLLGVISEMRDIEELYVTLSSGGWKRLPLFGCLCLLLARDLVHQ